jgi:hypothetical protein
MSANQPPDGSKKTKFFNLTLAAVAGGAGCITLIVVFAALFLGLWLDAQFNTRPKFTLVLVFASIPLSLFLMFVITRIAVARIRTQADTTAKHPQEDKRIGESKHS